MEPEVRNSVVGWHWKKKKTELKHKHFPLVTLQCVPGRASSI